jgi:hypothetical protein
VLLEGESQLPSARLQGLVCASLFATLRAFLISFASKAAAVPEEVESDDDRPEARSAAALAVDEKRAAASSENDVIEITSTSSKGVKRKRADDDPSALPIGAEPEPAAGPSGFD